MVRGRGYSSRGGGRGNSYRSSGSTYNRMGGSRKPDFRETGYRGGNSRYNSGYNSYDSRSRDKFQSRYDNRNDGKRSYRDNSRDRSDDRKRPRQEDSRLSSNYASTSSYRNRADTSRNRMSSPNYQARGSSSTYHRGQRDDSAGRRHAAGNDSMGPPKRPVRSSYVVRPRGSGTINRARGSGTARGGMRVIRKESTDMKIMRRKLLLARQRDRARLIKIARLTSSLRKRKDRSSESPSGRSKSRGDDKKSENEEDEDEEIDEEDIDLDEEDDEEVSDKAKEKRDKKNSSKSSAASAKKDAAGELDDAGDETGKDGEETDKDDEIEDEKDIKKEDIEAMDEDAIEGEDDETKEGKNTLAEKKTSAADGSTEETKEGKDTSKEKKDKERREESSNRDSRRKRTSDSPLRRPKFIKLTCVHCRMNCVTFKEYTGHLYSRLHRMSMRRVAIRQRVTLARMRTEQRNAQREIEEKSKEDLDDVKPQFCLLCRLNYRQPKAKHQLSEHHKDMKKFLMPYCQTCRLAFKSPMLYEAHRCALEHIRRKARSNEANSDVSEEEKEVDLNNFMTVDSVGEIDELDNEDLKKQLNEDDTLTVKTLVGSQYIKKVQAFYCELCRTYNAVKPDEDAYFKLHCGSRSHLKAFLLNREYESLHAKAKCAEKKDLMTKKEAPETDKKVADISVDGEEAVEDKLWEDVDKDLGDLLREVGPDEHDGEEEEEEDESVLNIDIESEKSKPSKELNGKKEEAVVADVVEEKPKKEPTTPVVVKVKKEKLVSKLTGKTSQSTKEKDKKTEVEAEE